MNESMISGWIFVLQKCIDSLQEAFIHPPEPCDARFNTVEEKNIWSPADFVCLPTDKEMTSL